MSRIYLELDWWHVAVEQITLNQLSFARGTPEDRFEGGAGLNVASSSGIARETGPEVFGHPRGDIPRQGDTGALIAGERSWFALLPLQWDASLD